MISLIAGRLNVEIHASRDAMAAAAAQRAAAVLRAALTRRGHARVILASAPSQQEMIAALTTATDLDWSRITVFHMDEYLGLPAGHPATFRAWQERHFLARVRPAAFHGIRGETPDPAAECDRYAELLLERPIDLVCLGIGENGHLAFNDPPVADFDDPATVKTVLLDEACRHQQVHDGCFPDLAAVPRQALTLTCPALMSAAAVVGTVPGPRKARAVRATLHDPIAPACPATLLRRHPDAILYLDPDSAQSIR